MITLFGFGSAFGLPDSSPFVVKSMVQLKQAGLEFVYDGSVLNLSKAPKGKLPYIHESGLIIADSHLIRAYVEVRRKVDLDAMLEPERRIEIKMLERVFENHYYWISVYNRWMIEDNWQAFKKEAFISLPFGIRDIVPLIAKWRITNALAAHGMGRRSEVDIFKLGAEDLGLAQAVLGKRPFFGGETPCGSEVFVFASLWSLLQSPANSLLKRALQDRPELIDYVERMKPLFFNAE